LGAVDAGRLRREPDVEVGRHGRGETFGAASAHLRYARANLTAHVDVVAVPVDSKAETIQLPGRVGKRRGCERGLVDRKTVIGKLGDSYDHGSCIVGPRRVSLY